MSWLPSSMAAPGGEVSCETPGTSVSVNKAEAHWLLWVHGVTSAVFCCLQASHKMAQFQREENLTSPFNEGVTREWETVAAVFEEYSLPQPTGFWEAEACIHWHCLAADSWFYYCIPVIACTWGRLLSLVLFWSGKALVKEHLKKVKISPVVLSFMYFCLQ